MTAMSLIINNTDELCTITAVLMFSPVAVGLAGRGIYVPHRFSCAEQLYELLIVKVLRLEPLQHESDLDGQQVLAHDLRLTLCQLHLVEVAGTGTVLAQTDIFVVLRTCMLDFIVC